MASVLVVDSDSEGLQTTLDSSSQPLNHRPRRGADALRIIESRFREAAFTPKALAQELDVTSEHLSRLVKAHTGQTVMANIRQRRVAEAAHLLRRTPLLVKEIAYAAGYSHIDRCDRDFKRVFGCSPTEYRLTCSGPNEPWIPSIDGVGA